LHYRLKPRFPFSKDLILMLLLVTLWCIPDKPNGRPAKCWCGLRAAVELGDEAENNDAADPHECEDDRQPVEVSLCDTGCPQVRRDTASEHVGKASTSSTVQQDEQGQQEARDTEHNLQNDLKNFHELPFERFWTV
jgi:hypothetical protein